MLLTSTVVYPIPYSDWHDIVTIFTPFATEPWAMLLDSADSQHPAGRYDIAVRTPDATLQYLNGQIISTFSVPFDDQDIFTALQCIHQYFPAPDAQSEYLHVPFIGGLVGYLGYALAQKTQLLPEQDKQNALPQAAFGFYRHAVIIDHHQRQSYLIAPDTYSFEQAVQHWQSPQQAHHTSEAFALTSDWQSNLSKQEYQQKIQFFKDQISSTGCYQINLAQRFHAHYQGSLWQAYCRLRRANSTPFSGYIKLPEAHILCLSPERFIQQYPDGSIQTKPIKGTRPRFDDPVQDQASADALRHSTKEKEENLLIARLMQQELSPLCQYDHIPITQELAIESFQAVHHLVSTLEGQLKPEYNFIDVLQATFPGASITGYPKDQAMQLIQYLEPDSRQAYCGSMLYLSLNGFADSNVTIRTLYAIGDSLYCWAGGGLMEASDPFEEYQETFDKLAYILPILEQKI